MNIKRLVLLIVLAFCFCLTACGEIKRPVDYPNTTWSCKAQNIQFSVSDNGEVKDAFIIDKNGNNISISFVFSDVSDSTVSITNTDGSEIYLIGTCTYGKSSFKMTISEIFNSDLSHLPAILVFSK